MSIDIDNAEFLIIRNSDGKVVFNSFLDKSIIPHVKDVSQKTTMIINVSGKRARTIKKESVNHTIYGISFSKDAIKSSKSLSCLTSIMLFNAEQLSTLEQSSKQECYKDLKRLIHNLVTINAHNIQEVFSIIPQGLISEGGKKWKDEIKRYVEKDLDDTSLAIIRIAKNNQKIKHEISVFNTLLEEKPTIKPRDHMIHRVLMNSFYVFFPDFTDKNVKITIHQTKSTHNFDYETVQVALYHFIDNATKYIAEDTDLDVHTLFSDDKRKIIIRFEMTSSQIMITEVDDIFSEGFSGYWAKKAKLAGAGIGLFRIKELLALNNAYLKITPGAEQLYMRDGVSFSRNVFEFIFNR